jgi:protein-S-isoprenylcysteine O-methyltransferase Ste14
VNARARPLLEGQGLHLAALVILLGAWAWLSSWPGLAHGHWLGVSTGGWLEAALGLAVAHQVYVWLCWRLELHGGGWSRILGVRAFPIYAAGFALLGIARALVVFPLAYANRGTLADESAALRLLALLLLLPALYLFYSVKRYFTFRRALGIDHFDPAGRTLPLERRGIFRLTRNGMYVFGFLLLWVPALWWASQAALFAAAFNHLYIWVHYFATERPDMRRLYGDRVVAGDAATGGRASTPSAR